VKSLHHYNLENNIFQVKNGEDALVIRTNNASSSIKNGQHISNT